MFKSSTQQGGLTVVNLTVLGTRFITYYFNQVQTVSCNSRPILFNLNKEMLSSTVIRRFPSATCLFSFFSKLPTRSSAKRISTFLPLSRASDIVAGYVHSAALLPIFVRVRLRSGKRVKGNICNYTHEIVRYISFARRRDQKRWGNSFVRYLLYQIM